MNNKIPKLHTPNLNAAKAIMRVMRDGDRVLSESALRKVVNKSRGWDNYHCWNMLSQNYDTIKTFLINNGLVTRVTSNGFVFWVLTQKGFRSRWENLFIEQVVVSRLEISAAVAFIEKMYTYMEPMGAARYLAKEVFEFPKYQSEKFVEAFTSLAPETDDLQSLVEEALLHTDKITFLIK